MLLFIVISVFLCVGLTAMSVYLLMLRPASAVAARLERIDPSLAAADEGGVSVIAERVAAPINKLVPVSAVEAKKLQKKLMQAGFRGAYAPMIFRAVQLFGVVIFPGALVLTFMLLQRPLNHMLIWGFLAAGFGFYLPRYVLRSMIDSRQQRIAWGLADALDLMVITVEAGLGINAALARVGEELKRVHPDIHEEFETVNLEIRVGLARDEALRNLAERTGVDDLRSLVAMIIQADRFGSSIARAVRVYSDALRTKRRQQAEQSAQKVAIKLLFPLTFFLFPTLFIFILGPAALNIYDQLLRRH